MAVSRAANDPTDLPRNPTPAERGGAPLPPFAPVVLSVDDDEMMRDFIRQALGGEPYELIVVATGEEGLEIMKSRRVDLLMTDLNMPKMTGFQFLEHVRRSGWDVDVIVLSAYPSFDNLVRCMRLSTIDFIQKPLNLEYLQQRIDEVLRRRLMRWENQKLHSQRSTSGPSLIGGSAPMQRLRDLIRRVAKADEVALICGETGTGKELVARLLHSWSPRASEPFLAVDCSTLSSNVVESELFGHSKGAFTGADAPREGLLRAAGRGTVFLDEVGELPLELQPKLLRALQEREVRPVGSNRPEPIEARILAATNRDLRKMVEEGTFRDDLYWRLNVITVNVPPLRARRDDILDIANHFILRYDTSSGPGRSIDPVTAEQFMSYSWPGNVRELENCIRRMLVLDSSTFQASELTPVTSARGLLVDGEISAVRSALTASGGSVSTAARTLGISRSTLYRKIREYGLVAS